MGDIDYYLEKRALENMREVEKKDKKVKTKAVELKSSYQDQKKLKSLNNQLSNAESEVNKLERELKKMDAELAADYEKTSAKPEFFDRYNSLKKKLERAMEKWESLAAELDKFN